ncbi:hypothetical protein M9H77_07421 [Catharanthus roseus]|uniref:Uncharacterized protein n=1 Tax=Catharanthus roseus TaxID=4058 RepID=A0ACC0BUX8_CATRO|nr:hypothetical protein M9H77_07421 [Catharanthus roseus]
MEALYAKLYNKYSKLKSEKDTHMEKLNREQEQKFINYVTAADEMIEYLRSENDMLGKQVSGLRSEMALIRSTKDEECVNYQRLLMEENKKNRELLKEIERLNNLQLDGLCCQGKVDKVDNGPLDKHGSSPAAPNSCTHTSERITRKRPRESMNGGGINVAQCATKEVGPVQFSDGTESLYIQTQVGDVLPVSYLPPCCKRRINSSGDKTAENDLANCLFQEIVEFAVGMKLSAAAQDEEFCVSVHHPSSGYSFSLTWVNNSSGEPELLYRLLSLGTFERIAPEWMRDVMMFSTSMCPIFFERVSRIIKLNH